MRWRILGGALIVLATGFLLAGAAGHTFARTDSRIYSADLAGASWIQAPGGGPHAYFRLSLDLPATPDLATLWIDADQQYQVYADGEDVASSKPPTVSGRPPLVDPVDLSWRLRKGPDDIGIEVVNADGGPAAFQAKLTLDFGDKQVSYLTSPRAWQAASSVQQVYFPGSDAKHASFSSVAFDASQWPPAAPMTAAPAPTGSLMPPAVVAGPLTGQVISAGASNNILASTVIRVPPGVSDAWLRVIASDAYTLSVDGRVVADQPSAYFPTGTGPPRQPQVAVDIYDIGPYLQAGRDPLMLHVYGSRAAAIYLDGVLDGASGPVRIATGSGWMSAPASANPADASPAVLLGTVRQVWPQGVRRTGLVPDPTLPASASVTGQPPGSTQTLTAPLPASTVRGDDVAIVIAFVLALWLGVGAVTARVARRPLGSALLMDAAGHLPALAAAGAVATLARLPNWVPPWPYLPVVFWLLVATLVAGKAYGFAATCGHWPQRLARLPHPLPRVRGSQSPATTVTGRPPWEVGSMMSALASPPFSPRLALAEAAPQASAVPLRLGTWPSRPAQWLGRVRLGVLARQARKSIVVLASRLTWANGGVILIALASVGQLAYRLSYEPYSGDETVSLLVAKSIRAHFLPRFSSGFLYFKGELYEYPLAVYTAIVGDSPAAVRLLTVLTYGATVLAFGLLLLPLVLRGGHQLAQVMLTLLFATAPMEMQEAQLVRMYQQEQLFAVLFMTFFLLALRTSRVAAGMEEQPPAPGGRLWAWATRWSIPLSAVTLVAMYLSLEESFILLPAVPVVLIGGLGWRWLRDRRWLKWGLPALAVIGIQYWLTIITKMSVLGFDRSNKPYIYYDPSQFYYYLAHYLLAIPGGSGGVPVGSGNGTLYLVTSLAVVAGVVGVARRDFGRLYLSTFFWLPLLVLSTAFSAYAERYTLILLPALFVLAGLGALDILGWLRTLLTATTGERERRLIAGLILAAAVPGFVWLAGSLPARVQDYGLALSRVAGVPYAQQQPDYGAVAAYMKAHEEPGDLFITLGSTTAAAYYVGRPPDMVIQPHPNKLIYLTERNGVVIENYFGSPVILTASDLEQVVASHRRIWLVTDDGPYFASVPTDMTDLIRAQFTEVADGIQSALYFKGN